MKMSSPIKVTIEIDESLPWPASMPLLEAKDIIRDEYGEGGEAEPHCLLGWMRLMVYDDEEALLTEAHIKMAQCIKEGLRKQLGMGRFGYINRINDDTENSKASLARAWNRMVKEDLGYSA